MKLILLGAPGAGKGTQASLIGKQLNIPTISTGDILRTAMKNKTPIGLKAKEYVDSGRLVPDDVIIGIVKERLESPDCKKGYILDGMPRTIAQADALNENGIEIDKVISIETDDETIIKRMAGRRVCPKCGASYHIQAAPPSKDGICDNCGDELIIRKDDDPDTLRKRLEVFHTETKPLIDYYQKRNRLSSVSNKNSIEETYRAIMKILDNE